ncbi:D-alanyl-D-alanine carboxypeptidase [Knoellia sp. S7-12]|uniref:D-alanyl-D-alanine carboxypeptidase/D-alanyl-D-alanine-endopeptidase n=1 Tax=Knoellia sp. S7-12 TaxID=3126698 RepID=UPI003367B5BD
MTPSRAGRSILASVVATVAALALAGGVAVHPASATGQSAPSPRPESLPPPDAPADTLAAPRSGQLAAAAVDTRSIPQRLTAAGKDPALGSRVSAVVIDASTGAVIYSRNASLALMPASNEKLTTAFVAIATMARNKTLLTHVKTNSTKSTVWLVGGGDPGLTVTRAREMAATTRSALARAGVKSVAVRVDDSLFPAPTSAIGWKTSYIPGDVTPVRALVVGGRDVMDTGLDAGVIFSNELKRLGISVSSTARAKVAPGATTLDSATSLYVGTLVAQLINTSNNDYAENIHRQSSLAAGKGATWAAANGHALAVLKARGVNTSGFAVQDGSGLSRSNRLSGATMTSLLLGARRDAAINQVFYAPTGMPTAGVSGTLKTRFATADTSCARGKVRAKTGWLSDVVSLSGTAYGVDGRERIFSIVENGASSPTAARLAIERFATAATGCNPA